MPEVLRRTCAQLADLPLRSLPDPVLPLTRSIRASSRGRGLSEPRRPMASGLSWMCWELSGVWAGRAVVVSAKLQVGS
jgi:hypothetical protein